MIEEHNKIFVYNNLLRFIYLIFLLFIWVLGLSLILIAKWFTILFGGLIVVFMGFRIIDILFFKELIFIDGLVIKKWYLFGQKEISLFELRVTALKNIWSGVIFFEKKDITVLNRLFMSFETFPIGNNGFIKIKKILIKKNVIKGDENDWNYSN